MADTGAGTLRHRVWLDLATPPQVLFFKPIVRRLRERGVAITVTARDFGPTVSLAEAHGYAPVVIGGETGADPRWKIVRTVGRGMALWRWSWEHRFDVALGYNSYAQAVAARCRGVPLITMMDFEYQPANRWCFRLARRIVVPEAFDQTTIKAPSVRARVVTHPGLKEHVYLAERKLNLGLVRAQLGLGGDEEYVLLRAPADFALYHQFTNTLFDGVVRDVLARCDARVVLMPRTDSQRARFESESATERRVVVLRQPVDGPSLIAGAAAVVSGGGTMAREAAVFGVPAFSVFAGRLSGVDRWLEARGRLTVIRSPSDLGTVPWAGLVARQADRTPWFVPEACDAVVQHVWRFLADGADDR